MYVWYLDSLCLGEIDENETLQEFLIKEFNQVAKLVERGDCESYPIWSEWYENIMFDERGFYYDIIRAMEKYSIQ